MTSASAPVSDLTLQELAEDPFAAYAAIRSLGRVVWVPALGRYAITRYDDIVAMDRRPQTSSTRDMSSPMVRSLGDMLMSKDGPPHRRERAAIVPSLRPRVIVDDWAPVFQRNADHLINGFVERGAVELDSAFGSRLAARNLADLLGLRGIEDETMLRWARAIVAGCGNYAQDEEVWLRNDAARGQITEAVAEVVAH